MPCSCWQLGVIRSKMTRPAGRRMLLRAPKPRSNSSVCITTACISFLSWRMGSRRVTVGFYASNHEYAHESVLHSDGLDELSGGLPGSLATIDKIRKSQAAHGVSVLEIRRHGKDAWAVVKSSPHARRITANTPVRLSGPAAGHSLLRTKVYDIQPFVSIPLEQLTDGTIGWGTLNNCAHGVTPWGTYLTCEENWNGYFGAGRIPRTSRRNLRGGTESRATAQQ